MIGSNRSKDRKSKIPSTFKEKVDFFGEFYDKLNAEKCAKFFSDACLEQNVCVPPYEFFHGLASENISPEIKSIKNAYRQKMLELTIEFYKELIKTVPRQTVIEAFSLLCYDDIGRKVIESMISYKN